MPKKKKRKPGISRRTKLLFLAGFIFILIPGFFYLNQTIQLMYFVPEVQPVTVKHSANPVNISIPAVGINLPVVETVITNNVWEIARNGASHLTISANPGEKGPIIFYGHNTSDRFGPIRQLKKGAPLTVATADNKTYSYSVVETRIVNPDELSVFFLREQETLYLYTCDGFADLKRFVVIAEPKR